MVVIKTGGGMLTTSPEPNTVDEAAVGDVVWDKNVKEYRDREAKEGHISIHSEGWTRLRENWEKSSSPSLSLYSRL